MRPPERYWRKAAKRALKRLRIRKPKPRVVRTTPPACAWFGCHRLPVGNSTFCGYHRKRAAGSQYEPRETL
jgi:hypothetical protein